MADQASISGGSTAGNSLLERRPESILSEVFLKIESPLEKLTTVCSVACVSTTLHLSANKVFSSFSSIDLSKPKMSSCYKPDMEHMLPDEVMFDILSRLLVKTIIWCKCVSKKWRNLVSESYFVDLHLSRSPQGLLIQHCTRSSRIMPPKQRKGLLKWVKVEDELNHHCLLQDDPLRTLDLIVAPLFENENIKPLGSVSGLIVLREKVLNASTTDNIYICNPITREYIILPKPKLVGREDFTVLSHGLGVSVSGEYKVVRICRRKTLPRPIVIEVLTLGMDQWIICGEVPYCLEGNWDRFGVFLNGYVHWVVDDQLYAFDLEHVTFQLFPTPPRYKEERDTYFERLDVVGGCLCCLLRSNDRLKVWAMKEHGTKGSWHEQVTFRVPDNCKLESGGWNPLSLVYFLNGKSVMLLDNKSGDQLATYCLGTGTIESKTMPAVFDAEVINYSPSFLKIKNFGSERVHVHVF